MASGLGPNTCYTIRVSGNEAYTTTINLNTSTSVGIVGLPVNDASHILWPIAAIQQQNGIGVYQKDATDAYGFTVIEPGVYAMEVLLEQQITAATAGDQLIAFFDICNTPNPSGPAAGVSRLTGQSTSMDTKTSNQVRSLYFATTKLLLPTQGGYTICVGVATRKTTPAQSSISLGNMKVNIIRLTGIGQLLPGVYT